MGACQGRQKILMSFLSGKDVLSFSEMQHDPVVPCGPVSQGNQHGQHSTACDLKMDFSISLTYLMAPWLLRCILRILQDQVRDNDLVRGSQWLQHLALIKVVSSFPVTISGNHHELALQVGVVCFGPTVQTIVTPTPKGYGCLARWCSHAGHTRARLWHVIVLLWAVWGGLSSDSVEWFLLWSDSGTPCLLFLAWVQQCAPAAWIDLDMGLSERVCSSIVHFNRNEFDQHWI